MALVAIQNTVLWPYLAVHAGTVALATANTLSAGNSLVHVAVAREAMTVTHVGFMCGAVTAAGGATVAIYTINTTTGAISSDDWGAGATSANTGDLAASANTYVIKALTNSATIAAGTAYGIYVAHQTGTSFVVQHIANAIASFGVLPYAIVNGTIGSIGTNLKTAVAMSSSTEAYPVTWAIPANGTGGGAFNNTNNEKRALKFTLPFPARCIGVQWNTTSAGSGDGTWQIQTDAGAEVDSSSTTMYGAMQAGSNGVRQWFFDNPATLSAETAYRAVLTPTSSTNVDLRSITASATGLLNSGFPGKGRAIYSVARDDVSSGAWVDTNTAMPQVALILDQIPDGAAVGGAHIIGG
jgi:hypothetical protein